jgi:phosphate transport system protein
MLRWIQRLGPESRGLTEIHARFLEMLQDGRHIFDAAANSLLGGTDPEVIREDLYRTDIRINETEQRIRREIVVHGSIHGAATFPALLVMMSLVKDAERVGDYAKNLFDLAVLHPDIGDAEERASLIEAKDEVSRFLVRTHGLFDTQDVEAAREFLKDSDAFGDRCDDEIDRRITSSGRNEATRVLCLRYFKRVMSHAANIVTSIVMPVDKLDYFPGKSMTEQ